MNKPDKSPNIEKMIINGLTYEQRCEVLDWIEEISSLREEEFYLIGSGDEANALASAIVGVVEVGHGGVVYSRERLIRAFMEYNGWSEEDAVDWYEYNTVGSLPSLQYDKDVKCPPVIVSEPTELMLAVEKRN